MEKIKIIDIFNKIANGEIPPRRIRYDLLEDDYNTLIYDEEELEYRFENDKEQFWEVANHHLNDYVEILEEDKQEDNFNGIKFYKNGEVQVYIECKQYDSLNLHVKEDNKIEKLMLHSHCGGTFEEEQAFRNRRDDEITTKINEIIDYLNKENK